MVNNNNNGVCGGSKCFLRHRVHRESLARTSSFGGGSSCCHHRRSMCQSAARLSTVGCYVHEPCPGDDGSLDRGEARGSAGSSMSSVSDCSGSRQAALCHCDDLEVPDDDEETRPPADSILVPARSSSRVCVVQGLLRANDDSAPAVEVSSIFLDLFTFCAFLSVFSLFFSLLYFGTRCRHTVSISREQFRDGLKIYRFTQARLNLRERCLRV